MGLCTLLPSLLIAALFRAGTMALAPPFPSSASGADSEEAYLGIWGAASNQVVRLEFIAGETDQEHPVPIQRRVYTCVWGGGGWIAALLRLGLYTLS